MINQVKTSTETKDLQNFINNLAWETEKFVYDKQTLISDIVQFYFNYFGEQTELINESNKLIFTAANNSASFVIEYVPFVPGNSDIIQVKEVYSF